MPILDAALWRQLSPLLDRALELGPDERAAFLDGLRAETPELATALAGLLADHDRAVGSGFLEEAAGGEAAPSLAGTAVGPYVLVEPLGIGGMGAVWRARRSDGRFEGDVAIKLLHPALLDHEGEARFRREGTILSRLAHPGIARLYDAGISSAGQPYLVLELVEGTRLDRCADAQRLDVRGRLELFLQVADAVAQAHSSLVVHRDLKPSNILVDRGGRVRLLDFGIATLLEEGATTRTATAARALTPEYAAPEQLDGRPITTATDVYALGVLLYELLTGGHPTLGDNATPAALVLAVMQTEPARMSDSVARAGDEGAAAERFAARATRRERLARLLAGDLDTIVAKALKKEPAERYLSVAAFADDVRRHLAHQPVRARRDSAWYRLRKLLARRRLEAGAAALTAAALVAATTIAIVQARASARQRDRALADLARAEITNDFTSLLLSGAAPGGKPISISELLRDGERVIERRFAGDPGLQAHLLILAADRYKESFDGEGSRRVTERAFALTRELPDLRLRAAASCRMAYEIAQEGDAKRTDALLTEAYADLAREPDGGKEEAYCRLLESDLAYHQDDLSRAIRAGERALALEQARRGPPGRTLEILNALGMAYGGALRFADSERSYGELFELFAAQARDRTRPAILCRGNRAVTLENAGQYLRAAEEWELAVAISREVEPERGPRSYDLRGLARTLSIVGRHEAAIAAADEAVTRAREASAGERFRALITAGRVRAEAGEPQAAAPLLAQADALVPNLPANSLFTLSEYDRSRALAALALAEPAKAAEAAALARAGLQKLAAAKYAATDEVPILLVLARAENDRGRLDDALAAARRALRLSGELRGDLRHTRELGAAGLEVARALAGRGELPAARQAIAAAIADLRPTVGEKAPELRRAVTLAAAIGR